MLQRLGKERGLAVRSISREALARLASYSWPGNVRELENVIHRSAVMAQSETILVKDLPAEVGVATNAPAATAESVDGVDSAAAGQVPGSPGEPAERPAESVEPAAQGPVDTPGTVPDGASDDADLNASLGAPRDPGAIAASLRTGELLDLAYERLREESRESVLIAMEREVIRRALLETGGNQVKTSALLGITRGTLRKRIEQFDLKI
jgi:two-component system nitrogen regulation response regulator GlnG